MRVNNQPDMGECGRANATRVRFWLSLVSPGLGELGMVSPWFCNIVTTESNNDFHIVGIVLTYCLKTSISFFKMNQETR